MDDRGTLGGVLLGASSCASLPDFVVLSVGRLVSSRGVGVLVEGVLDGADETHFVFCEEFCLWLKSGKESVLR